MISSLTCLNWRTHSALYCADIQHRIQFSARAGSSSGGLVRFAPCIRLVRYGSFVENCHFSRHYRRSNDPIYFFVPRRRISITIKPLCVPKATFVFMTAKTSNSTASEWVSLSVGAFLSAWHQWWKILNLLLKYRASPNVLRNYKNFL